MAKKTGITEIDGNESGGYGWGLSITTSGIDDSGNGKGLKVRAADGDTGGGQGGAVKLYGGDCKTTNGSGGDVVLSGGLRAGTGADGEIKLSNPTEFTSVTLDISGIYTDQIVTFPDKTGEIAFTLIEETAGGADHTVSGTHSSFPVGEAVVFGDVLYMKSDGKLWKSDASAATTTPMMAMAMETISADNGCDVLLNGFARDDTWTWTVGGEVYVSLTAGALTQTAPSATDEVVQIAGIATHADRMLFNPQLVTVIHV